MATFYWISSDDSRQGCYIQGVFEYISKEEKGMLDLLINNSYHEEYLGDSQNIVARQNTPIWENSLVDESQDNVEFQMLKQHTKCINLAAR